MSRIPTSRKIVGTATAVLAVVLVVAAIVIVGPLVRTPAYALPAPLKLSDLREPASVFLDATINRLRGTSEPAPDPRRPVTHVHTQLWAMDTTDVRTPVAIHDVHEFWAPDRSGARRDVILPEADAVAARARTPVDGYETYAAGDYGVVFDPAGLSPDPVLLAGQLAANEPPSNGIQVMPRAVAAAFQQFCLPIAQRIAALRVLGDVPELTSRGPVVDRAGRAGTALTIDSGDPRHWNQPTPRVRDILVFDDSGVLLAHERLALDAPKGLPDLPVPAVTAYTLYLSCARLPSLPV